MGILENQDSFDALEVCNVNVEKKVLPEIQDSNKQHVAVLDENLQESVENKIEMGQALVDAGASVENLESVKVKLAVVREPVVLTCVAFLNVGDLGIAKHSVELFA